MRIRPYRPADDPALMALERQCPRGEPHPFVHYRRRFVDRAELFGEQLVLVGEDEAGELVAAVASGIKETQAGGQPLRLAYLFDVRVAPRMRRQGLAVTLLQSLEAALVARGCDGAYAHVVATNRPSVRLFETLGYATRRELLFLSYEPAPEALPPHPDMRRTTAPPPPHALDPLRGQDLFVDDVASAVRPFGYARWELDAGGVSLSHFELSRLFQQVPAREPWPTEEAIARRGKHWRLFHPLGEPEPLDALWQGVRAAAGRENVRQLSLLAERAAPLPPCFESTSSRRDYVLMSRPFAAGWDGAVGSSFYCDPREL